jgi:hypothetical protein
MVERDWAKGGSNKSGWTSDWLTDCKLRNDVTRLNKKKKNYYEAKINDTLYSIYKSMWTPLQMNGFWLFQPHPYKIKHSHAISIDKH